MGEENLGGKSKDLCFSGRAAFGNDDAGTRFGYGFRRFSTQPSSHSLLAAATCADIEEKKCLRTCFR